MGTSLDALRNPRLFISLLVNRTFLNTQISLDVYPYQPYNPYRRCAKGTEWQGEQQVKKDDEAWRYIRLSDFSGLSVSFPVPRKRDLAHTYWAHNPSNPEDLTGGGLSTRWGRGSLSQKIAPSLYLHRDYIQKVGKEREFSALSPLRFPFFWQFCCPIFHSNI